MIPEAERALVSFAPGQPVWDLKTMRQALYTMWGLLIFRLAAGLATFLAAIALILTLVGLYGVVSYDTGRRTREIGIRIALGARPAGIVRMIVRSAIVIVAAALVVGLGGSLAASRLIEQFLIVSPLDPLVYALLSVALTLVVLLACLVPARKAVRIDPNAALRVH
jgi:ABC-type antimicrobial peptide transport system permease subunit